MSWSIGRRKRQSYLLKGVLDDLTAIDVRDPGEEVPQDGIGLPIYIALIFWYRLRLAGSGGKRRTLVYPVLQQVRTSLLNNHLSKMVANTSHMMFKEIGILRVLLGGRDGSVVFEATTTKPKGHTYRDDENHGILFSRQFLTCCCQLRIPRGDKLEARWGIPVGCDLFQDDEHTGQYIPRTKKTTLAMRGDEIR